MSRSVLVLVRIAVLVPEKAVGQTADAESLFLADGSPFVNAPSPDPSIVTPLVTAEMFAFYREHPENN